MVGLVARAIALELSTVSPPHSLPVTLNTAFCGSVFVGTPVNISVEISKKGRRYTFVRAQLKQNGNVCLDANGVYGEPSTSKRGDYVTAPYAPSTIPKYEDCKEYENLLVELGIYPPTAARNDFRTRRVDPATVSPTFLKFAPHDYKSPAEVPAEVMNLKLEAWSGFTDGRPMDATSLVYFTDYLPPINMSLGLRGNLPDKNHFWDWWVALALWLPGWLFVTTNARSLAFFRAPVFGTLALFARRTTISYSISFLNPPPSASRVIIRSEAEFIQDTDERRCLVQNTAIDAAGGKVICVARQAALATAYPLRGAEAKI